MLFSQLLFEKTYGIEESFGNSIIQSSDDCFLICGSYMTNLVNKAFLFKMDSNGDSIWYQTLDDSRGSQAIETSDKGFAMIGTKTNDVLLVKINSDGDTLWTKMYGKANKEEGNDIIQTQDKGYILCGYTDSYGQSCDIYLVKTDSTGNLQWQKNIGRSNLCEYGKKIRVARDGGFIILGWSNGLKFYVVKTDNKGDTLWTSSFGNSVPIDQVNDIVELNDGYLVLGNIPVNYDLAPFYLNLTKLNRKGNIIWRRNYDPTGKYFNSMIVHNDTSLIIIGEDNHYGNEDLYILVTDTMGNPIRDVRFGGNNDDWGTDIIYSNDNYPVVLGVTSSFGIICDIYVIKISSDLILNNKTNIDFKSKIMIYPNPVTDHFYINNNSDMVFTVEVFDLIGKMIVMKKSIDKNETDIIYLPNSSSGMVLIKISNSKIQYYQKLVIINKL